MFHNRLYPLILKVKLFVVIFENTSFFYLMRRKLIEGIQQKNNIIIVGGELFNKGAQAMTFTAIDQIKKIRPYSKIFLFSGRDFLRNDQEKEIYSFTIMPWNLDVKISILDYLKRLFVKDNKNSLNYSLEKIIKEAEYFIDVSGYALGSEWGPLRSIDYLLNIAVAKKYSIPYYILPQSIGPFNYSFMDKLLLLFLMKSYLKYPKRIFVREKEGLSSLYKFTKDNVEKAYDIVLQGEDYDLSNIYSKKPCFKNPKVEFNSVGVIPNTKIIERLKKEEFYSIYLSMIDKLMNCGKKVYLLGNSVEDMSICKKMKEYYVQEEVVKLIAEELNAVELERVIKQFDFIITSRYHSIVHAYKNGIPALVIGWAKKYPELLDTFGQLEYYFDVGNGLDKDRINLALSKLLTSYEFERKNITEKMGYLSKNNDYRIFRLIGNLRRQSS